MMADSGPPDWHSEVDAAVIALRPQKQKPHLLESGFWLKDAAVTQTLPYIVKGIISKGQLVVVWGPPGSGKSFMTTDMLCAVGSGESWHGRRTQRGICIYVIAESSRVHIENRIAALRQERPEFAESDVFIIPLALDLLHAQMGDVQRVIETAKLLQSQGDIALIAIDTLAVTFGGGDENTSSDMGLYVANVKQIMQETGAGVLLVHHSGKNELMRGSSALLGALDGELSVEGKPGDGERMLKAGKIRDGGSAGGDLFAFRLRRVVIGMDQDGDEIDTCVVETLDDMATKAIRDKSKRKSLGANQKAVLRCLESNGGTLPRVDLAHKLKDEGMPRNRVSDALATLLESGMVIADNIAQPPTLRIP